MGSDSKVRGIGARKASGPISINALIEAAEKVILTDRNAMLKAQSSIADLTPPGAGTSNPLQLSSLSDLSSKPGAVKLLSSAGDESSPEKVVDLGSLRRKF